MDRLYKATLQFHTYFLASRDQTAKDLSFGFMSSEFGANGHLLAHDIVVEEVVSEDQVSQEDLGVIPWSFVGDDERTVRDVIAQLPFETAPHGYLLLVRIGNRQTWVFRRDRPEGLPPGCVEIREVYLRPFREEK